MDQELYSYDEVIKILEYLEMQVNVYTIYYFKLACSRIGSLEQILFGPFKDVPKYLGKHLYPVSDGSTYKLVDISARACSYRLNLGR